MTSASLEMSGSATSQTETPRASLDENLSILADKAREFARLGAAARANLLRELVPAIHESAARWVSLSASAKGLAEGTPAESEEWFGGPVSTLRNVRLLARSLDGIATDGKPRLPKPVSGSHDGRAVVDVFPSDGYDSALFAGFTCKVRMLPGISQAEVRQRQAPFYDKRDLEGGVSLVLGAGNVSSIPPMDALYKMFASGNVCAVKLNPVNEYLAPVFEEAFKPLLDRGYLRFFRGGASVGAYLVGHAAVTDVHITGSDRTHDILVYGPPGPEQDRRKAEKNPILKKPITSELGSVTPVVIVPGNFSERELNFVAENIATMVVNNASCNCNAAKMLVTSKGWPQRGTLLRRVESVLANVRARKAYYPGAFERFERLTQNREGVRRLGDAKADRLPWTLMFDLDSKSNDPLFTTEPFCPILSETALDESDPAAFLKAATYFANEKLWGTLSAVIMIHPKTEKDPEVGRALDEAVAKLRYGAVAINHWGGIVYGTVTPPWGAHPSSTPENIQGGLGWVHNTFLLDGIEKAVLRGPLTVMPKPPWFVSHGRSREVAEALLDLEAAPSWLKVPKIAALAMLG